MKDIVADYDEMKATAILVDKTGHNVNKPGAEPGIVSRSRILKCGNQLRLVITKYLEGYT